MHTSRWHTNADASRYGQTLRCMHACCFIGSYSSTAQMVPSCHALAGQAPTERTSRVLLTRSPTAATGAVTFFTDAKEKDMRCLLLATSQVLQESYMMIPDSKSRLAKVLEEMEGFLCEHAGAEGLPADQLEEAKGLVAKEGLA